MTSSQEIDRKLFEQIRDKLFTSIISDALDSAGFRNQAMSSKIRPLDDALFWLEEPELLVSWRCGTTKRAPTHMN